MRSYQRVIQQKIYDADIQNAVIIIPALADIMPYNELREGISGQGEGLVLCNGFFRGSQRVGRLDIGFLASGVRNKVYLPRHL